MAKAVSALGGSSAVGHLPCKSKNKCQELLQMDQSTWSLMKAIGNGGPRLLPSPCLLSMLSGVLTITLPPFTKFTTNNEPSSARIG